MGQLPSIDNTKVHAVTKRSVHCYIKFHLHEIYCMLEDVFIMIRLIEDERLCVDAGEMRTKGKMTKHISNSDITIIQSHVSHSPSENPKVHTQSDGIGLCTWNKFHLNHSHRLHTTQLSNLSRKIFSAWCLFKSSFSLRISNNLILCISFENTQFILSVATFYSIISSMFNFKSCEITAQKSSAICKQMEANEKNEKNGRENVYKQETLPQRILGENVLKN